jgi:Flp pilus assembly protein TadD
MFPAGLRPLALVILGLAILTLTAFAPAVRAPFSDFDDHDYLTENPRVAGGLSPEGVRWAFTAMDGANWHPLTWLAHQTLAELFGLDPGRHHLAAILLQATVASLLFLALRGMTGSLPRSAVAAFLFAVHPLRVESVVWASQLKDLLAGLCWTLSLLSYLRYIRRPSAGRHLTLLAAFSLGLLCKATVVTLPLALLALDFWPLGRWGVTRGGAGDRGGRLPALLGEKAILAILAMAGAAVTLLAQGAGGAVKALAAFPLPVRLGNACLTLTAYLGDTLLPRGLSPFYPHPGSAMGPVAPLAAGGALLLATAAILRFRREIPSLGTGWWWYLATVLPTLGLIQVGMQGRADRYTYLPQIGLAVAAAWAVPLRRRIPWAAPAAILSFALLARRQTGYWRDGQTLFAHAAAVTRDNWLAHRYLGLMAYRGGNWPGAVRHLAETVRLRPEWLEARANLADALLQGGDPAAAVTHYRLVAERVNLPGLRRNLGTALFRSGDHAGAALFFEEALGLDPSSADLWNGRGAALLKLGRQREAEAALRRALQIAPAHPMALYNLGLALEGMGRDAEAAGAYRRLLAADPRHGGALRGLARLGAVGEPAPRGEGGGADPPGPSLTV